MQASGRLRRERPAIRGLRCSLLACRNPASQSSWLRGFVASWHASVGQASANFPGQARRTTRGLLPNLRGPAGAGGRSSASRHLAQIPQRSWRPGTLPHKQHDLVRQWIPSCQRPSLCRCGQLSCSAVRLAPHFVELPPHFVELRCAAMGLPHVLEGPPLPRCRACFACGPRSKATTGSNSTCRRGFHWR